MQIRVETLMGSIPTLCTFGPPENFLKCYKTPPLLQWRLLLEDIRNSIDQWGLGLRAAVELRQGRAGCYAIDRRYDGPATPRNGKNVSKSLNRLIYTQNIFVCICIAILAPISVRCTLYWRRYSHIHIHIHIEGMYNMNARDYVTILSVFSDSYFVHVRAELYWKRCYHRK